MASRWGVEEVRRTKEFLGFDPDKSFVVPDGVREVFAARMGKRGADARAKWEALFAAYAKKHPAEAAQIDAHPQPRVAARLGRRHSDFCA